LKIEASTVTRVMSDLVESGLLTETNTTVGQDTVIERTATQEQVDAPRPSTVDILLRYSYEGPQDERNFFHVCS
jgi:hypothetical protein